MVTKNPRRGEGEGLAFLRAHSNEPDGPCLVWPMFRDLATGYGRMGYLGKPSYAHRVMCELAHGPAPTPEHEVSHSCGNGRGGCVHPAHINWETRSENHLQRRNHGTAGNGGYGRRRRLTVEQIESIRSDTASTNTVLARRFDVSRSAIRKIKIGEIWKEVHGSAERRIIIGAMQSLGRPVRSSEIKRMPQLRGIATPDSILKKMTNAGQITRVSRGVYALPQLDRKEG